MKLKHETWVTPHALFEIGIINYLNNKPVKALKRFNKVKNNYDSMYFCIDHSLIFYLFFRLRFSKYSVTRSSSLDRQVKWG